ncbi:hypothetical protein PHSY_006552 [Pseudozyma hubeiensis SY62]|uniref:Uncharacterized protein n=1 Tax=Pseudozyma hubeiensis (strain SY62) TaxID=1305764 RepID=R9PLI4_PSEHS|nr:hypothetical protein PHSY_006552 [Pseudozyma hubeiensis SY62]GAC98955.1 hypothetical protein PHSY_006552 [Pseudozyma hubeiensis SY62]
MEGITVQQSQSQPLANDPSEYSALHQVGASTASVKPRINYFLQHLPQQTTMYCGVSFRTAYRAQSAIGIAWWTEDHPAPQGRIRSLRLYERLLPSTVPVGLRRRQHVFTAPNKRSAQRLDNSNHRKDITHYLTNAVIHLLDHTDSTDATIAAALISHRKISI